MRRVVTFFLLFLALECWSQVNLGDLVDENVTYLELQGFLKPEFSWDMQGKAQAFLNEGINRIEEGMPHLALPEFDEAAKLEPQSWIIHYYRGICLKLLDAPVAAEAALKSANTFNPGNFFIMMEVGKSVELQKKFDEAEKFYERAAEISPKNALPQFMLASVFVKNNKLARAKRKYADCVQLDSTFLHGEVRLAIIETIEKPDSKKALRRLEYVLQKDPNNRTALIFHAALVHEQNIQASLRDIDKLVQLDPTNTNLRFMRGIVSTKNGDYEQGFSDLRKVIDAQHVDDYRAKGQQSAIDKRLDIQYAGYYVVSQVYGLPDADGARIKKAYCLLFTGDFEEALKSIDAVAGARTNPLCLYMLGVVNEHKGNHQQAFISYDSALRYDRDIFEAHKKRGIYYTELNLFPRAVFDFTEMLRINPASVSAYRFRGLALYHMGNAKLALEDFNKYLSIDSASYDVHGYRGVIYHDLKQPLLSTLDLLQSNQRGSVAHPDALLQELTKLAASDPAKAIWYTDQFLSHDYQHAYRLKTSLLMDAERWSDVETVADSVWLRIQKENNAEYYSGLFISPSDRAFIITAKGICLARKDKRNEALTTFNLAIKTYDRCGSAYFERGKLHLAMGNDKAAQKDFKAASKLGVQEATRY
jgi:tetratricopeptide (TPR) repeat protein